MGDDHVAEGAGFLVEAATHLDRERLRHVDLDVVDVVAVPDRLEHAVGKAQRQQVLHRLATDVVVDSEDLLLVEDGVDERVELPRRGEVAAEGLLHDHPRPLPQPGPAKILDHPGRGGRRQSQIVQQLCVVKLVAGGRDRGSQLLEAIAGGDEPKRLGEAVPGLALERPPPRTADRLAGELGELLVGEIAARGADQGEPLRHQAGLEEVEDPRQQLAAGQVPGRSEEHDHLIVRNRRRRRRRGLQRFDCHRFSLAELVRPLGAAAQKPVVSVALNASPVNGRSGAPGNETESGPVQVVVPSLAAR